MANNREYMRRRSQLSLKRASERIQKGWNPFSRWPRLWRCKFFGGGRSHQRLSDQPSEPSASCLYSLADCTVDINILKHVILSIEFQGGVSSAPADHKNYRTNKRMLTTAELSVRFAGLEVIGVAQCLRIARMD